MRTSEGKTAQVCVLSETNAQYQVGTHLEFGAGTIVSFTVIGRGELFISGFIINLSDEEPNTP